MTRLIAITCLVLAATSCSESSDNVSANIHADVLAEPATFVQRKSTAMTASKPCGTTMRQRTTCMIELILADVRDTYNEADGGGIARITSHSSTSYTVSLPQEERIDLFTYEFEVSARAIVMKSKTPGTL